MYLNPFYEKEVNLQNFKGKKRLRNNFQSDMGRTSSDIPKRSSTGIQMDKNKMQVINFVYHNQGLN